MTISLPDGNTLATAVKNNRFLNNQRFQEIGIPEKLIEMFKTNFANQTYLLAEFSSTLGNRIIDLTKQFNSTMNPGERSQITAVALACLQECATH